MTRIKMVNMAFATAFALMSSVAMAQGTGGGGGASGTGTGSGGATGQGQSGSGQGGGGTTPTSPSTGTTDQGQLQQRMGEYCRQQSGTPEYRRCADSYNAALARCNQHASNSDAQRNCMRQEMLKSQ